MRSSSFGYGAAKVVPRTKSSNSDSGNVEFQLLHCGKWFFVRTSAGLSLQGADLLHETTSAELCSIGPSRWVGLGWAGLFSFKE